MPPAPAAPPLFGRIAVEMGFVTPAQLEQALRVQAQAEGRQNLGSVLMSRGALNAGQVRQILARQREIELSGGARLAPAPPPPPPRPPPAPPRAPAPAPEELLDASALLRPVEEEAPAPVVVVPPPSPPLALADDAVSDASAKDFSAFDPTAFDPSALEAPPARPAPVVAPPPPPVFQAPAPAYVPPPRPAPLPETVGMPRVAVILEAAERKGASDVHFHVGAPPMVRLPAGLMGVTHPPLDAEQNERLLLPLLTEAQRRELAEVGDLDFAYVTPGGLRTRANVYRTHVGTDATFRLVRRAPPTLAELGLPPGLARFTNWAQGLVLVTGPAGCGKTTTLAALVNLVNEERAEHVLTFEDPIEIVHPPKRALVNQRQVGRDTESFARALRGALREDPDVMVVGELRDRETISLAVTAAETGHLVLGSMHTNSAARTVARLIDAFPPAQQAQVRTMLSESLRGVVSQRMLAGTDGRRVVAAEVLVVTPAMGNLVREGKLFQIRSQMQTGRKLGMCTLDEALRELVQAGRVTREEAARHAENPAALGLPAPAAAPGPAPGAPAPGRS